MEVQPATICALARGPESPTPQSGGLVPQTRGRADGRRRRGRPPRPAAPRLAPPRRPARGPPAARVLDRSGSRACGGLLRAAMPATRCGRARSLGPWVFQSRRPPAGAGVRFPAAGGHGRIGAGGGGPRSRPRCCGGRLTQDPTNGRPLRSLRAGSGGGGRDLRVETESKAWAEPRRWMQEGSAEAAPAIQGLIQGKQPGISTWTDPGISLALYTDGPLSGKKRNLEGGMMAERNQCLFPFRCKIIGFPFWPLGHNAGGC